MKKYSLIIVIMLLLLILVGCNKSSEINQNNSEVSEINEEETKLVDLIKKHNTLITDKPTLSNNFDSIMDKDGLYVSYDTNDGRPTYYFRGAFANNYIEFAGLVWRIIRINEDGTIRLMLKDQIYEDSTYYFGSENTKHPQAHYTKMYYSNTDYDNGYTYYAKKRVDTWYEINIINKDFDSFVATTTFCEQAKVKDSKPTIGLTADEIEKLSDYNGENAMLTLHSKYVPNFKCSTDGNGKGILNSKVGLITYDEAIHAGGYANYTWTMSPAGFLSSDKYYLSGVYVWELGVGGLYVSRVSDDNPLKPVINLAVDTLATGTGTSADPYVVVMN